MNFCPNCGKKNETLESFCSNCGRDLKDNTLQVSFNETVNPHRIPQNNKVSTFVLSKYNFAVNLLATLLIYYFYLELRNYMDTYDDKSMSILRLLLMMGVFLYLLVLHYKKTSHTIWIPGVISVLLAYRCFVEYSLFKEYVQWTETQGFNTQMSVDPSAAGALSAYGVFYSVFVMGILVVYLIKYGNSSDTEDTPHNIN